MSRTTWPVLIKHITCKCVYWFELFLGERYCPWIYCLLLLHKSYPRKWYQFRNTHKNQIEILKRKHGKKFVYLILICTFIDSIYSIYIILNPEKEACLNIKVQFEVVLIHVRSYLFRCNVARLAPSSLQTISSPFFAIAVEQCLSFVDVAAQWKT